MAAELLPQRQEPRCAAGAFHREAPLLGYRGQPSHPQQRHRSPACKHDSLDSAEKEAKRLVTLLKKKAYVLCTIKSVEDTQYKIEDCRPGESDLPF